MAALCPNAILLQYVNPMAINTWAIAAKYPAVRQVGLCHSVQGTAKELAGDLGIPLGETATAPPVSTTWPSFCSSNIARRTEAIVDLYPALQRGYRRAACRTKPIWNDALPQPGAL